MSPFETLPTPERDVEKLMENVRTRAGSATEKVRQRVEEIILPNLEFLGSQSHRWLSNLQNDFDRLVEDPNDESGGGNYAGWTADEIKELYAVLYGEEFGA